MSQVSLLSVEISAKPEPTSHAGNANAENEASKVDFSEVIKQHLSNDKTDNQSKYSSEGGKNKDEAAKLIDKTVNSETKKGNEHILPVPIKIVTDDNPKDVELGKAFQIVEEAIAPLKEKVNKGADETILPVPIKPITDEESNELTNKLQDSFLIEKSALLENKIIKNGDEEALPVPIKPITDEIATNTEQAILAQATKLAVTQENNKSNNEHTLPVPAPKNPSVMSAVKAALDSETKVNHSSIEMVKNDSDAEFEKPLDVLSMLDKASRFLKPVNHSTAESSLAEQKVIAKNVDVTESELTLNQADLQNNDKELTSNKAFGAISENGNDKLKVAASIQQKNSDKANTQVIDEPKASIQVSSKELTDSSKVSDKAALAANVLNQVSAGETKETAKIEPATKVTNQAFAAMTAKQLVGEDKASTTKSDADIMVENMKKAESGAESELALMTNADKKPVNIQRNTVMPQHIADTQTATINSAIANSAARSEESFESAINQLTRNTVQTQKSITALNTETIAIYRKDFAEQVKDKVMVMINQKIQQVDIQLDPPELGNVHVRVNLQNEQAAVQFVVQNQQAKDALEQNIAKLRDMMAENGVDVGDANIEQRQPGDQQGNETSADLAAQEGDSGEQGAAGQVTEVVNLVKASSTGVDYYA